MPTNTYVALDKVTVSGSSTTSINFNSISSSYTDLVVVCSAANTTTSTNMLIRFNSDSSSLYSQTTISGTGSAAGSNRYSNQSAIYVIERHEMTSAANSYSTSIINIQNYSNTNIFKSVLSRSGTVNSSAAGTDQTVSLWRSTSAITSVTLLVNAGAFAAGSTFSLYGIAAGFGDSTPKAVGGVVTEDSSYYYHTFLGSSTFTPLQTLTVDYLVVAGGGGGNSDMAGGGHGGGGGAGGYRYFTSQSLTSGTKYLALVGGGGTGVNTGGGTQGRGGDSCFGSNFATGGGNGGGPNNNGLSGGSGGGARSQINNLTPGTGNLGGYTPAEGTNGSGTSGGGAVSAGPGGGATNSISGTSVVYATGGNGGSGGADTRGAANTGNGGSGGTSGVGKPGGSGIVIVRYAK